MSIIQMLVKEMEQEAQITRKMLSLIPNDKYQWQPHPKSMTIEQLSTHIAEIPTWVSIALHTSELDFAAQPYEPAHVENTEALLKLFEKCLAQGKADLEKATESDMEPNWTMRNGDEIYLIRTKGEVIRMAFSQIVHHRAQLGVYLRLLNIPIPGSYGPSADDMSF